MEEDLDKKILSCINGETIVKPFTKVYEQVKPKKSKPTNVDKRTLIYSEGEESIYHQVIANFLKENPEFLLQTE